MSAVVVVIGGIAVGALTILACWLRACWVVMDEELHNRKDEVEE